MHKIVMRDDRDWLATRLTPRKYYPPKPSREREITPNFYTSPWHPGMVEIPGVEGLNICLYDCIRQILSRRICCNTGYYRVAGCQFTPDANGIRVALDLQTIPYMVLS